MKLHLNLKKKWFDMIRLGDKKEEYREIKPYWIGRLCGEECRCFIKQVINQKHDIIIFSNGYAKDRPQFEIALKGIRIDRGRFEWGAEKGKKYFVLELGEVKDV